MNKLKRLMKIVKMFLQKPDLLDIELGCYIKEAGKRWKDTEIYLELESEINKLDLKCRKRFDQEDYLFIREYIDWLDEYRDWYGWHMYETALNEYKKIVKEYRTNF